MAQFEFKHLSELPFVLKNEALRGLYFAWAGKDASKHSFEHWADMRSDEAEVFCVLNKGRLIGAVSFMVHDDRVTLEERWAKPSREFIKQYDMTVARWLGKHVEKVAIDRKLRFILSDAKGSGIRLRRRMQGELPSLPRSREQRRRRLP